MGVDKKGVARLDRSGQKPAREQVPQVATFNLLPGEETQVGVFFVSGSLPMTAIMHFLSVVRALLELPVEGLVLDGVLEASRLHDGAQQLEVTSERIPIVPEPQVERDHLPFANELDIHRAPAPVLREARRRDAGRTCHNAGEQASATHAPVLNLLLERAIGVQVEELDAFLLRKPVCLGELLDELPRASDLLVIDDHRRQIPLDPERWRDVLVLLGAVEGVVVPGREKEPRDRRSANVVGHAAASTIVV